MRIFLLGAGASAATLGSDNAPVSRDFGKVLEAASPGWQNRFPFLASAVRYLCLQQPDISEHDWSLGIVWNGIDENYKLRRVVRHLELPALISPVPQERLYQQYPDWLSWDSFWVLAGWELKRALTLIYGDRLQPLLASNGLSSKWLAFRVRELNPTDVLVSMNYDLLAESLARLRWAGAGNCRNKGDDRRRRRHGDSWPLILKPHGSLDWVFMTNWISGKHLVERTASGLPLREVDIDLSEDFWERRPVVVAPVRYKDEMLVQGTQPTELTEVLNFQWQTFVTALGEADEFRVFGYRFPPEDSYGQRMLQEGLRRRARRGALPVFLHLRDYDECDKVKSRLEKEVFHPASIQIEICEAILS